MFNASVFSLGVDATVPLEFFRVGILVLVFNLDLTYDQNIFGLLLLLLAKDISNSFLSFLVTDRNSFLLLTKFT